MLQNVNWIKVGKIAGSVFTVAGTLITGIASAKEQPKIIEKAVEEYMKSQK